jgi:hypothetical protein
MKQTINVYNKIEADKYEFGQDARTKEWYCKSLKGDNLPQIKKDINEANGICNEYNKKIIVAKKTVSPAPPSDKKKTEKTKVRGIK